MNLPKQGTVQRILYDYLLRVGNWRNGGELEDYMRGQNKKASTTDRDLRRLRTKGLIESELREGASVSSMWWRVKREVSTENIINTRFNDIIQNQKRMNNQPLFNSSII